MKKTIWIYGLIAGLICSLGFGIILIKGGGDMDMQNGMIIGFAAMIVAFSLIFVAIKNYRDKKAGGTIIFGNAFKMGLFIALIASTIYVAAWLFTLYNFYPDFAQQYVDTQIENMRAAGATAEKINAQMAENAKFVEMYKNPLIVILFTYAEVLWLGVVFALIAAAVLKKNPDLNKQELNSWLESKE